MLEASWQATSAEIVANCFRKARISKEVQDEEIDTREEEPSCSPDLAEAWILLRMNGGAPDDVQICDFLYADNCTVTTEEMTDKALWQKLPETRVPRLCLLKRTCSVNCSVNIGQTSRRRRQTVRPHEWAPPFRPAEHRSCPLRGPHGSWRRAKSTINTVRTDAAVRKAPLPRSTTRGIPGEGGNNSEEADTSSGHSKFGSGEEKTLVWAESASAMLRSLGSSRSPGHAPRAAASDHLRRRMPPP
ncbi:hypothetical protein HPB50_016994 [Hyalomma asiaticum]|uniref:Uncharacterized protein n=1 Tax=Hyalomma asiaticum TaxID=266040 RepID=A0ACB7S499_HYAAI|nr:hypothetical protein HPB50_016994 [Hyalomma asiaticum]